MSESASQMGVVTGGGMRHVITWSWGSHVELAFDVQTDVLDLGWLTASNFSVQEVNGSVVISLPSNNQSYTLSGIGLGDLGLHNIAANDAQTVQSWAELLGAGLNPPAVPPGNEGPEVVLPGDGPPDTGSPTDPSEGGSNDLPDAPSEPSPGETPGPSATQIGSFVVSWSWGQKAIVAFDSQTDTIDFGWMSADHFAIAEINGEVVIEILSNRQSYTLQGVSLSDLSMANISALDASALARWQATLGSSETGQNPGDGDIGDGQGDQGHEDGDGSAGHGHHTHMHVMIARDSASQIINGFMPAMGDVIEIRSDVTADRFSLFEESGDALGQTVRIEILNDGVTSQIVLTGIGLQDLSLGNFSFGNQEVLNEVTAILGGVVEAPQVGSGYDLVRDTDGSNPAQTTGTTVNGGVKYRADTNADDIVGFRPGVDQLDFGSVSVHGMILTKSETGELVIDSPWSSAAQIVQGVTFENISIEDFGVVGNEHLRQDIGGVISWEQGVGPMAADTVYIRSHEYGRHEVIDDFDPTYMKLSFLYFGTRERLSVQDTDEGLVISSMPTGQSFTFTGVSKADLIPGLVEFHFDQVIEDNLEEPFGFSQDAVTLVDRTVLLTPLAPDGASTDGFQVRTGDLTGSIYAELTLDPELDSGTPQGPGDPVLPGNPDQPTDPLNPEAPGSPDQDEGPLSGNGVPDIFAIGWSYGQHNVLAFDPELDILDFGWVSADAFELSEVDGSVVISLTSNNQSYTLQGVSAAELSMANIRANDPMSLSEWSGFVDWM